MLTDEERIEAISAELQEASVDFFYVDYKTAEEFEAARTRLQSAWAVRDSQPTEIQLKIQQRTNELCASRNRVQ
jgi:hypothetical protein